MKRDNLLCPIWVESTQLLLQQEKELQLCSPNDAEDVDIQ